MSKLGLEMLKTKMVKNKRLTTNRSQQFSCLMKFRVLSFLGIGRAHTAAELISQWVKYVTADEMLSVHMTYGRRGEDYDPRGQMRHPSYRQSSRYKDHSGSVKGVRADPDTAPR